MSIILLFATILTLDEVSSSRETDNRAAYLRTELEMQLTKLQIEVAQARAQAKSFEKIVLEVFEQVELE